MLFSAFDSKLLFRYAPWLSKKTRVRLPRHGKIAVAVFACLALDVSATAIEPAKVLSTDVGFIPEMAGSLRTQHGSLFFVGREKLLVFLNEELHIVTRLAILNETAAIDFADINGDGNDDLIEFTQRCIFVRFYKKNQFGTPQIAVENKFSVPLYVNNLEQTIISVDFDRDGFSDLFIPAEGKFLVYQNLQNGKFKLIQELPFAPKGSFTNRLWQNSDLSSNSIRSTVIIPQPIFLDFNHDHIVDAAARIDDRIYFFLSDPKIKKPFVDSILRIYPFDLQDIYVSFAEFADLDGDDQYDLIFSAVRGLGLNIRSEIKIFRGENFIPDPKRSTTHQFKGGVYSPLIIDKRKTKLLILPSVDTGITFFINYVLRSSVTLTLLLLDPFEPQKNPLSSTKLRFSSKDTSLPGFAYADFNADGYTDFALGVDPETIAIYAGNEDFSKDEALRISAPAYSIYKTIHLKDGSSALFIFMTPKSKTEKKTVVYLAKIKF